MRLSRIDMIFEFLKYCLGNKTDMSMVVAKMDWRQLYSFASKQTILGFCFDGIERLGKEYPLLLKENPIGQDLLMAWMGKAQQIRRHNMKVNAVAAKLYRQLREDGLRCCILKGQGNALMYPNPYSRNPGDVDVWVKAGREEIAEYARKHFTLEDDVRYHHLETSMDGVPVELHFLPCVMNNPIYNHRLQKWFKRNADLQCSNVTSLPDEAGEIAVPTTAFNVIYQLCHLYHHFFDEGIGMRQIIDYHFNIERLKYGNHGKIEILKYGKIERLNHGNHGKIERLKYGKIERLQKELKYLGLWKFAGAVMYVLHETLGLSKDKMICPMDEKRGKLLLSEIVDGGNFGKHYAKYGHFTQQSMAKKYFLKIWRNMHFVRYYPAEALSEPIFRTWHFFWRQKHK